MNTQLFIGKIGLKLADTVNERITNYPSKSNIKRQKVLTFANKRHEKRITTLSGFMAKLQQSLDNNDAQFMYYTTKKILPFIALLRDQGIIQNFHLVPTDVQQKLFSLFLSPSFSTRLLVVHLKSSSKTAPALRTFRTFTVPSRRISITYHQLLKKALVSGNAKLYILNTSKGLLTHTAALHYQIGGEIVCEIQ